MRLPYFVVIFLMQLFCPPSMAGLVPLKLVRGRAKPDSNTRLVARMDTVEYTLLADRIEAGQTIELESGPNPQSVVLGIPLPKSRWEGCQDVSLAITKGDKSWKVKPKIIRSLPMEDVHVARWLSFSLKLAAGEKAQVSVSWWQPYSQLDLNGYPRLVFEDPLWTAGSFDGSVSRIVRRVRPRQGIHWGHSTPSAVEEAGNEGDSWEGLARVLTLSNASPKPGSVFKVTLNRTKGALSACTGADPWLSVDGDTRTVFAPIASSADHAFIDLISDCKGFGTGLPDCNEAGVMTWDLGLSLRTPKGKAHGKFVLEGYWGRRRIWKKTGRQNKPLPVERSDHLTRYRVKFTRGFPEGGPGEISLVRFEPKLSTPGFQKILQSKGWHRMAARCLLLFELRNPASLRHAVLALKPHSKTDAFMLNMDCTDGRNREPFHEPIECHHSAAQHRAMGIRQDELHSGHSGHFKRKRPWRIELPLDPSCVAYRFRLQAPPMLCSKKFHAVIPHIVLDY